MRAQRRGDPRLIVGVLLVLGAAAWGAELQQDDPPRSRPAPRPGSAPSAETVTEPVVDRPMILWFHSVAAQDLESLRTAVTSRIVSHVLVYHMHRLDAPLSDSAREAINVVRQARVKVIWGRNLWPYYANRSITTARLHDPAYFVDEIKALRQEGETLGADAVCLDLEPYGQSPMKGPLKSSGSLEAGTLKRIKDAVRTAVDRAGPVDFVLPAGSLRTGHPYAVLAGLGTNRISESTYYVHNISPRKIPYPYEIFGAHVNTRRTDSRNRDVQYYLVADVFDRSALWSQTKGVLLYTDKDNALAVAHELHAFVRQLRAQGPPQETAQVPPR